VTVASSPGTTSRIDDRFPSPHYTNGRHWQVVLPTVEAMAAAGRPYRGVLYAGLMLCRRVWQSGADTRPPLLLFMSLSIFHCPAANQGACGRQLAYWQMRLPCQGRNEAGRARLLSAACRRSSVPGV
jgi:hypothetical protein